MPSISSALIAGGGIAGTATALTLQRAGIEPTLYEASPRGDLEIGAAWLLQHHIHFGTPLTGESVSTGTLPVRF